MNNDNNCNENKRNDSEKDNFISNAKLQISHQFLQQKKNLPICKQINSNR